MRRLTITQFSTVNVVLLAMFGLAQPSLAQLPSASPGVSPVYNAPPLPPGQGAPAGRRDGGASRGRCENYGELTALVPITDGVVWGQTTAAQPTLWFYLPTAVTTETPIDFVVQDPADNFLYSTSLTVDVAAGNLAIALPDTVELPVGQPHYWTLSLYCDPERPAASVFVKGTIERVVVEGLTSFSADAAWLPTQAGDYASQGIWHDALTILGQRLQADGADVVSQEAWSSLLEQVELGQAAAAPVLPCCVPASME